MNTYKKVALLCDYGLDDAIATLYMLKHAQKFDKIDIVPVGGNFPLSTAFVNAKRLLTCVKDVPANIRIVDAGCAPQSEENIPEIHGKDGMGDILPSEYSDDFKVISYCEWLDGLDSDYVIVSLGPCTVTADIFRKKGALPLIIMGGNIAEPPNYKGYEFNHGLDTASFAECVRYPHAVATLDTCHVDLCNLNLLTIDEDGLFSKLLLRYLEMSQERGETVCSVYDMTAVVYLIHPERFETALMKDKDENTLCVLKYIADVPIFTK